MEQKIKNNIGITLVALVITIIVLLILAGISISAITGSGLFSNAKLAKEKYAISEAKEKIEMAIFDLRLEQESKGKNLTKEDLPKINSEDIDVRSTEVFPVEVACGKYLFGVDENFVVVYLREVDGTYITYVTDPEGYTNNDEINVKIKIINPKGIKTVIFPSGKQESENGKTEIVINYPVNKNDSYTFKVYDVENKEMVKDIVIDQIDKLEPLEFTAAVEKQGRNIIITAETEDSETDGISTKSGIDHYEYCLVDENSEIHRYNTANIENVEIGKYEVYVVAYDKAGNSRKSNIENVFVYAITEISAGMRYSLALDSTGDIWAWGNNTYGQLGIGTNVNANVPTKVESEVKFSKISASTYFSLALDENGDIWSWGKNENGELGMGTNSNINKPTKIVVEGKKFSQISAGDTHSLAIDTEGNLWAWGNNNVGQLGNGNMVASNIPRQIETEEKYSQISAGASSSFAIDIEGRLWSWGNNQLGGFGNGTTEGATVPILISNNILLKEISHNYNGSQTQAIDIEGNLWTWGSNQYGTLGTGESEEEKSFSSFPVKIKDGIKFNKISAGVINGSAIDIYGNIWLWGLNAYGQLGTGNKISSNIPIQVKSEVKFTKISAGGSYFLAIDIYGDIWTWGFDITGQGDSSGITIPQKVHII